MTTTDEISAWVDAYKKAWASNDADDVAALFTEDAVYNGRPHDPEADHGREAIIAGWLENDDEPGTWSFDVESIEVIGNRGYVQAVTHYTDGPDYDNLWVISFTDGRASEFTEWYMARDE